MGVHKWISGMGFRVVGLGFELSGFKFNVKFPHALAAENPKP